MNDQQINRRDFLADLARAATAGNLVLQLPWLAALAGCARDRAPFVKFTPAEASTMRAFAAQIIPSDDGTPGAEEVGAVYFIDRALTLPYFASHVSVIRVGLADLDGRALAFGARGGFASLPSAQQIAVMRQVEHDPFFATARSLVIIGTFADPSHGGNRDRAAWTMIGMEHRPSYTAPFGWYDAEVAAGHSKSAA
ncbi:MAG: gluconate 2-dehydrogenase subunit 3 family protein [bacterium]